MQRSKERGELMDGLRIHLFGKFEVYCGEPAPVGLYSQKPRELFCFLLTHRDRPHPRETLADLLWTDRSPAQSKKYLRKTLWQLQATLASHFSSLNGHVLLVEPDWIQLNPQADLWLDVADFEQAFTRLRGVPGRELDSDSAQTLQSAVSLYRGELLENWYQDWCLCERERLRSIYRTMLDKLIGYCQANGQYEAGLVYAARILRYDRARERTHRQLMRLHYLAGDRTTALRQYKLCVAILKEELGVTPTKRTLALYEQIRSDQLDISARTPMQPRTPFETMNIALPEIFDRLNQIYAALTNAE
jgi:DNA-binding SARP family transcriptional activator